MRSIVGLFILVVVVITTPTLVLEVDRPFVLVRLSVL
jgi:hypothetical protein